MKGLIIGSLLIISSTVFAGNYEARQDLLQARDLINSALSKMDRETSIVSDRLVKNAKFICRETSTSEEVTQAIVSAKKEVNAKCDGRCEIVVEFKVEGFDCHITAKGIR